MPGPSFQSWLDIWKLVPDGEPFATPVTGSWLLPVRQAGRPAILKVSSGSEEIAGGVLMEWWGGEGAALVLERQDEALLLERAVGVGSLAEMARKGRDEEATEIICDVVEVLHAPRNRPPPETLVPLDVWFRDLAPAAQAHGGVLTKADAAAKHLLADPRNVRPLHGDVHHGNILDFEDRGWLAIDPKGVLGERGYDYANSFCNPDVATALTPGRLERRLAQVSARAEMEPRRLLMWVLAYSGLSAAWTLGDGGRVDLSIVERAAAVLDA